ncbi:MAG: exodeoxyribonuclease VII small subunit [Gammaproteobacteria bacterium]
MPKKPPSPLNFEQALHELEALVARMEQGEISLEDSLRDFERGIELTRSCQKALQEAEQKVQILMEKNGQARLEPFASGELDDTADLKDDT